MEKNLTRLNEISLCLAIDRIASDLKFRVLAGEKVKVDSYFGSDETVTIGDVARHWIRNRKDTIIIKINGGTNAQID